MNVNPSTTPTPVTVYRTFLELDPHHGTTRALLADAHKAHRITMSPFAYAMEENDFFTGYHATGKHPDHRVSHNILWAVNYTRISHPDQLVATPPRVRLLLQADIPPDFEHWRAAAWTDALLAPPTVRPYTPNIDADNTIEYQIVIHPRRNTTINGTRKTIVATHEKDIHNWWHQKATAAGLKLQQPPTIDQPGRADSETKNLKLDHHRLTGKATIIDPARYAAAARCGIGPAKAYGFGLLLTK